MSPCQRKAITKLQHAYRDVKVKVSASSFMFLASSEIAKDWSVLSLEISCAQIFFSLRLGFMKPRMSYNFLYTWVWLWIYEPSGMSHDVWFYSVIGTDYWAWWMLAVFLVNICSLFHFLSRACKIYIFVYVHVCVWMYLNLRIQSEADRHFPQTLSTSLFK